MSSLIPFSFESHEIRVLAVDGEPWFVAKDIAQALGYAELSNPSRLFASVPYEWKGVNPIHTLGGVQDLLTLSEQGFYFFVGRSDKPKALSFQKWAAGEVFPSIRKTGSYSIQSESPAALAEHLAGQLAGKVPIDGNALADLLRYVRVMINTVNWLQPIYAAVEEAAAANPALPCLASAPVPHTPPAHHLDPTKTRPRARRRTVADPGLPPDRWYLPVRDFVERRGEVTSAEVLAYLGIAAADQSQNHKKRISKILNYLGFWVLVVKRNHRTVRVYRRLRHD